MSTQFSRSSWASRDFPIHEWKRLRDLVRCFRSFRFPRELAEYYGLDRLAFSLHGERLELRRREARTTSSEGTRRDPDLVLACAGHQPSSKRSRVAKDCVGPAEGRADLAGEDAALADADVDGERHARVNDRTHRPEEPLLVIAERLGRARDEDDPSAVLVDVALEERHLVLLGGALHRLDEEFQRLSRRLGTFGLDRLVDPGEADEGDGRVPVLPLERPHLEQLRTEGGGDSDLQWDARDVRKRSRRSFRVGCCLEQQSGTLFVTHGHGIQQRDCLGAEKDLAGLRRRLHLHRPGGARAGDEELAVQVADEEELEASGVEACVHLQLDGPGRGAGASDRTKRAPHVECGPRGPRPVIVAVVQEEEGIASELEKAATLLVRDLEECRERRIHHVRHFLRARAPEAGQLLGHGRETGDVDERQRPLELEPVPLGACAQPLEGQTRDKRDEVGASRR
jgi:hypothetical protein